MAYQIFQWTECIVSNILDWFWTVRVYWHMGITLKLASFHTAWHCALPDILIEWVGNKFFKFKCLFGPGSIVFGDTSNICNLFVQFHKRIEHQSDTQCIMAKHPYNWKNTQWFFLYCNKIIHADIHPAFNRECLNVAYFFLALTKC